MELTSQQLKTVSSALHNAQRFLYSELDCICDDEYGEEILSVLEEIDRAIEIITQ